jgi:hypothetical protein
VTPNSLYPAYVDMQYHSAFGTHHMIIPTLNWNDDAATGGAGSFDAWDSSVAAADSMINSLVDLFAPFFKADTHFDLYTIYTLADAEATPQPRVSKALTQVGTSISTSWSKAVETTFTFRTDTFGIRRLVFLDAPSGNLFDKINQFSTSPEAVDIRDALADEGNGWSARDNGRPETLVQITYTLNDKLRREYGMT